MILLPAGGGYQSGIKLSREMAARDTRYFLPRQFENPLNLHDHEHFTGPEILGQLPGPIDAFVAGYGTGGSLGGCGRAIKAKYPQARIVAMEPADQEPHAAAYCCCFCIGGVASTDCKSFQGSHQLTQLGPHLGATKDTAQPFSVR